MYKVMVADDERLIRKSIINRVDWTALGLEVACEADNGMDAYQRALDEKPDILLVDIKMPILSGLDVIRKLRPMMPGLHFIVLSGYDDFAYAKEAIKLRAANYIKKPIDVRELSETLREITAQLDMAGHADVQSQTDALARHIEDRLLKADAWQGNVSLAQRAQFDAHVMQTLSSVRLLLSQNNYANLQHTLSGLFADKNRKLFTGDSFLVTMHELSLLFKKHAMLRRIDASHMADALTDPNFLFSMDHFSQLNDFFRRLLTQLAGENLPTGENTMDSVKEYIDQHFFEPLTVAKLAEIFFLHQNYLSYAFKLKTGENLTTYLERVRIRSAQYQLVHTNAMVREVAQQAGYNDPNYFAKVFKKLTGLTPADYRNQRKPT